jgi:hypothetical protein
VAPTVAGSGWTNPLLFVPLLVNPRGANESWYRTASVLSFTATTIGWVGIAASARPHRRDDDASTRT